MISSTAVVTGAASGIGAALARRLRPRVGRLVVVDVNDSGLLELAGELDAVPSVLDVSDPQSMEALAERVGAPTHLCLNAGILSGHTGAPWEAPPAEWQRMLAVNLGGVVNGLRAFVPPMLTSGDPCSILITGSLAGVLTWPGGGPYAATKHAVVAVAEQAAQALQHTNIAVTLLCPALVRTAMSEVGESANDVAEQALSAMDARQFAVIPAAWSAAISRRAQGLTDGRRPTVPTLE